MNLEQVVFIVFSVVGVIQFAKGFISIKKTWVWAVLQVVFCFLFAAVWALLPTWVSTGIVCLSMSQIGYETIIQNVKKRLDQCNGSK